MSLFEFIKKLFGRNPDTAPSTDAEEVDDSAPGWEAIDAAVEPLYPGQEPLHWGTVIKWMLGVGSSVAIGPLQGMVWP